MRPLFSVSKVHELNHRRKHYRLTPLNLLLFAEITEEIEKSTQGLAEYTLHPLSFILNCSSFPIRAGCPPMPTVGMEAADQHRSVGSIVTVGNAVVVCAAYTNFGARRSDVVKPKLRS